MTGPNQAKPDLANPTAAQPTQGAPKPSERRGRWVAILTGALSILIGLVYLVLITVLDARGPMQPPPPEALGLAAAPTAPPKAQSPPKAQTLAKAQSPVEVLAQGEAQAPVQPQG